MRCKTAIPMNTHVHFKNHDDSSEFTQVLHSVYQQQPWHPKQLGLPPASLGPRTGLHSKPILYAELDIGSAAEIEFLQCIIGDA
jgi:hypothetical protein